MSGRGTGLMFLSVESTADLEARKTLEITQVASQGREARKHLVMTPLSQMLCFSLCQSFLHTGLAGRQHNLRATSELPEDP